VHDNLVTKQLSQFFEGLATGLGNPEIDADARYEGAAYEHEIELPSDVGERGCGRRQEGDRGRVEDEQTDLVALGSVGGREDLGAEDVRSVVNATAVSIREIAVLVIPFL